MTFTSEINAYMLETFWKINVSLQKHLSILLLLKYYFFKGEHNVMQDKDYIKFYKTITQ